MATIKWHDSCTYNGWCGREFVDDFGLAPVETHGFIIRQDSECVIIAQSYDDEHENWCNIIAIHPACIVEIVADTPNQLEKEPAWHRRDA